MRAASLAVLILASSLAAVTHAAVSLTRIGEYRTGEPFGTSGAEIVHAHAWSDAMGRHLVTYSTNSPAQAVDIVDFSVPSAPRLQRQVPLATVLGQAAGGPTSVSIDPRGRGVAVSVPNANTQLPGWVVLLDFAGDQIVALPVGALPDMLTFTPDGSKVLVANEGEPNTDYTVDPEGSVSIVDVSTTLASAVVTATARFTGVPEVGPVRHFGPNAAEPARDFEPEYIAVTSDSRRAFVNLQEANAIAELDLATSAFTVVRSLGFADFSVPGHGLDPSDRDGGIHVGTWPIHGMYQPDGIAVLEQGGRTLIATANEGDTRAYTAFNEVERLGNLRVEAPLTAADQDDAALGRLQVTTTLGDADGDGAYETGYAFGTRSFSLFDASSMSQVFDSGDQIEQQTAVRLPTAFNSNNDSNSSFDTRSDNSGPEPETVAIGVACGRTHAFVGLERVGGVMVFDVTDARAPVFETYATSRDFSVPADDASAGGISPEGLDFVPAAGSPVGQALLLVANEGSGTIDVWQVSEPGCLAIENCTNGVDDDGDGNTDCADADCATVDTDGDGALDCAGDCAPADPGAWSVPLEVPRLDVREQASRQAPLVAWSDVSPAGGPGTRSAVASDRISTLWSSRSTAGAPCLVTGAPASGVVDPRMTGVMSDGWWYLVEARNACGGGGWGRDSRGDARTTSCP